MIYSPNTNRNATLEALRAKLSNKANQARQKPILPKGIFRGSYGVNNNRNTTLASLRQKKQKPVLPKGIFR